MNDNYRSRTSFSSKIVWVLFVYWKLIIEIFWLLFYYYWFLRATSFTRWVFFCCCNLPFLMYFLCDLLQGFARQQYHDDIRDGFRSSKQSASAVSTILYGDLLCWTVVKSEQILFFKKKKTQARHRCFYWSFIMRWRNSKLARSGIKTSAIVIFINAGPFSARRLGWRDEVE